METSPPGDILLLISPSLTEKMDRALISPEDARRTIEHCEATGVKLLDNSTGDFIGHLRLGALTYWVRYTLQDGAYTLVNIYCHRVSIEEEAP